MLHDQVTALLKLEKKRVRQKAVGTSVRRVGEDVDLRMKKLKELIQREQSLTQINREISVQLGSMKHVGVLVKESKRTQQPGPVDAVPPAKERKEAKVSQPKAQTSKLHTGKENAPGKTPTAGGSRQEAPIPAKLPLLKHKSVAGVKTGAVRTG